MLRGSLRLPRWPRGDRAASSRLVNSVFCDKERAKTDVPALRGSGDHVFVAMSETSLFLQRATSTSNFEPLEETEEQHVHRKYRTY